MRRIAITGVSGYIGSVFSSRLGRAEAVERIIGIDVKPPKKSAKLRFYRQDILDPLSDIFIENEVDSAIHLAFAVRPTHDGAGARRVDIGGASNFLEACRRAQVGHILYLSSHTVYGAHPDNTASLSEDAPLRPLPGFQYSLDKAEAERVFADFAASNPQVTVTILRSCPVLGPNAGNSVVAAMFKPVMIAVAGYDPLLQFVHEDDLAEVLMAFLEQKRGGIFNVASDGQVRYSQIARMAGRKTLALPERLLRLLMGFSWVLRLQNESPASGLEFIKYPPIVSTEKLKRELGFQFRHSSEDALLSFIPTRGGRR